MLWQSVRRCFEENDGSLPTIELKNLSPPELGSRYAAILDSGSVPADATFWDNIDETERRLKDVDNAASLVANRQAAPFHFTIDDVRANDAAIPTLGIHVFQDMLAVDYRMGPEWSPDGVFAFFLWLEALLERTQSGELAPSTSEGPLEPEAFLSAWKLFQRRGSSGPRQA